MSTLGQRVRLYRRRARLSQSELAGEELSASYVSLIEADKRHPSPDVIRLLAGRLGCTPWDLQGDGDEDARTAARLELSYAQLALANGEPASARTRLDALLTGRGLDRELEHEALVLLAQCHEKAHDLDAAIRTLHPVYEQCLAGRSPLPVPVISVSLCRYYLDAGDLQAAVRVAERGVAASAAAGLAGSDDHLKLEATMMMAFVQLGDLSRAAVKADEILAAAQASGSAMGQAAAYWNAAMVAETRGRLREALHLSERALALMAEQGAGRNLARLQSAVAWFLLNADPNRAGEAAGILDRSVQSLRDLGSPGEIADWESNRSLAHVLLGEAGKAERMARRALLHLRDAGDQAEAAQALITLGDALVAQSRLDEGLAGYRDAGRALTLAPLSRKVASLHRALAQRLLLAGDHDAALGYLQQALDAVGIQASVAAAEVAFGLRRPAATPATPAQPATSVAPTTPAEPVPDQVATP